MRDQIDTYATAEAAWELGADAIRLAEAAGRVIEVEVAPVWVYDIESGRNQRRFALVVITSGTPGEPYYAAMKFILYVTTAGGKIELEAEDVESAVAEAIRREDEAGRPGAVVCGLSCYRDDIRQFVPSDDSLKGVAGTTLAGARP